ncbi:MAG: S8 family peptidase, partial [Planctomycetota bacterium]
MWRRILFSILILLVSTGFAASEELPYKPGELLVRFADADVQASIQKTISAPISTRAARSTISNLIVSGARVEKEYDRIVPGLSLVKLPAGVTVEESVLQFMLSPSILYAEPNYKLKLSVIPNDTRFSELWGMHNTGQAGGKIDADIDAPEAWDIHTVAPNIVVAVTDTGVDYGHIDLAGNMWINEAELNGVDGEDDDVPPNGYIDDIYGYDFGDDDDDPMDDSAVAGHGTHVAGTIGAVGNNSEGVAGVCWDVNLMALKMADSDGILTQATGIEAIQYATNNGAKVINASWGGNFYSQGEYDAIQTARDAGIVFVASAGNETTDNDSFPHYPSAYDLDNIIAVMATDNNDGVAFYSNYGANSVDLGAPGGAQAFPTDPTGILSTIPGDGYGFMQGTSMAAPHVAGAAALVWSVNPGLTYSEVKAFLLLSTD